MNTLPVQKKKKLLIVDDEPELREILRELLSDHFEITLAPNGREAVTVSAELRPDAILMDVMMPGMDGITAVKEIRKNEATKKIPVLLLTAANTPEKRIEAFDFGADDFISKPFQAEEVLSRVQSKLKRAEVYQERNQEKIEMANLVMNLKSQEVYIDQNLIDLGPVEYQILHLLLVNAGDVVTRKMIMEHVWRDEKKSDRLIDAHLTSLRKKMSILKADLQTVYGEGYRLKLPVHV